MHILAATHDSCKKSLTRLQAKDATTTTKAKREGEIFKSLKNVSG